MPKCPKCKVDIEELEFDVTASCSSSVTTDEVKNKQLEKNNLYHFLDYDIDCLTDGVEFNNFRCPECDEIICQTEEKAIKFLNGEK